MARPVISDYLQAFPFWIMDVTFAGFGGGLPVFNPLLGFASVTSPDINIETYTIREGIGYFDKHVVQRATIAPITARRGVLFIDSDFYLWTISALSGGLHMSMGAVTPRKNLILVHYFSRVSAGTGDTYFTTGNIGPFGPLEFANRIPARAWSLMGCVPTNWKAGNDFEATDGSVSVAEVTFQCEDIHEISAATIAARAVDVVTLGGAAFEL